MTAQIQVFSRSRADSELIRFERRMDTDTH
jgi:hypothetical protein